MGFLQTGQVVLEAPSEAQFSRITRQIIEWGSQIDMKRPKEAYFHLKVLSPGQYVDVIRLLAQQRAKRGESLGLLGMRERMSLVGGELDSKSAPGRGTEVHAFFPVLFRPDPQEP
jgi:hypothetical protein